jgi:hypothetical protein
MKIHRPGAVRILIAALLLAVIPGIQAFAGIGKETYYFAGNDRPAGESDAIKKIEKEQVSDRKFWLHTYIRTDTGWDPIKSELIRVRSPEEQIISLYHGNLMLYRTVRKISRINDGNFLFEETKRGTLVRTGHATELIPLHLEGEVTEYYDSGMKRSEAFYRDNQLVWNHNWLENGEKYIETIFYSVDTWPRYLDGDIAMKAQMNNYILSSKYYSKDLSGTVLLGFVIMEDGHLAGIHLVNKPMLDIAEVVRESLETLPGKWQPAILDNRSVRCYMTFPVNFMVRDNKQFENVQMVGNMIFYNYR